VLISFNDHPGIIFYTTSACGLNEHLLSGGSLTRSSDCYGRQAAIALSMNESHLFASVHPKAVGPLTTKSRQSAATGYASADGVR
jgi:hypothetical protein